MIADIYMYLNNTSDDQQKRESKRSELIENCRKIRSMLETEFHPHEDNESSSYLDMNGVKSCQSIKHVASDKIKIGKLNNA